jgi:hypothetical protein
MMARLVRATIRYGRDFAEIIRCVPIQGPLPQSELRVDDRSDGAWVEVLDGDRQTVYRQVLPDPFAGQEAFGDAGELTRQPAPASDKFISLELPWPGGGSELKVHARKRRRQPLGMATGKSLVAQLPLEPQPLKPVLGAAGAPKPTIRQIWGAANPKALTFAFFAEGFTEPELPLFHKVVDRCVSAFATTPPFDRHLANLRVAEVATISRTSGIRGTKPGDTVFKARFQEPPLDRVILVDQAIASRLLDTCFSRSAVCLVVANTSKYGGSGGAATVFSCEPYWAADIAIHELGHTFFGLADEYDAGGQASTMEPIEPNVCRWAARDRLKWADLVALTTPLPTQRRGAPVPAGTPVGAYEGAKFQPSSMYRAEFDCKMRTPGKPFCAACRRIIEQRLKPYSP